MSSQASGQSKLSASAYLDALERVEQQFALLRFAVSCSESRLSKFNKGFLEKRLGMVDVNLTKLNEKFPETADPELDAELRKMVKSDWRKRNRHRDMRFRIEFLEDRLNQSELLLLVAHFESFLKVVHMQYLLAAPGIVLSKGKTEILVKSLFSKTDDFRPDLWLRGAIFKEVKVLDREGITEKADYFQKHYKISFGSDVDLKTLVEIMEQRNKVSHEIFVREGEKPNLATEPERVSELPVVPDDLLCEARRMFREIPSRCVSVGAKRYPAFFKS